MLTLVTAPVDFVTPLGCANVDVIRGGSAGYRSVPSDFSIIGDRIDCKGSLCYRREYRCERRRSCARRCRIEEGSVRLATGYGYYEEVISRSIYKTWVWCYINVATLSPNYRGRVDNLRIAGLWNNYQRCPH